MINIIDNEHIEAIDVTQNIEIEELFKQAKDGNYKYYRAVGVKKIVGLGEPAQCKIYSYDETAKKGSYANTTIEKSPDLWFENPHYVAAESDPITETTIDESESDLVETVEVETVEPEQKEVIVIDGNDPEKAAMFETITTLSDQVAKLTAENEQLNIKCDQLQQAFDKKWDECESLTAKANAYDSLQSALAVLKSFLA